MNHNIRTMILEIERLMDDVLAECQIMGYEGPDKRPPPIEDIDDAALIDETVRRAQETLSEIPLQYK